MIAREVFRLLKAMPRGGEINAPLLTTYLPGYTRAEVDDAIARLREAGLVETFRVEGRPDPVFATQGSTMYFTQLSFTIGKADQIRVTVDVDYKTTGGQRSLDRSEPDDPIEVEVLDWGLADAEPEFHSDVYPASLLNRWGSLLTPAIEEYLKSESADEDLIEDLLHFQL